MKHKHAEVLKAIADGKDVQYRYNGDLEWYPPCIGEFAEFNPLNAPNFEWRVAPEILRIGDMDVPKPCREAPPFDTVYYYPFLTHSELYSYTYWDRGDHDLRALASGLVHRTKEAAITHAKALIKISGGTYE
jgi:hypothetical protein